MSKRQAIQGFLIFEEWKSKNTDDKSLSRYSGKRHASGQVSLLLMDRGTVLTTPNRIVTLAGGPPNPMTLADILPVTCILSDLNLTND